MYPPMFSSPKPGRLSGLPGLSLPGWRRLSGLFLLAGLLALAPLAATEPITEKNWLNHPAIVEVRNLFNQIEKGIAEQHWSLDSALYNPALIQDTCVWRDPAGVVRKVQTSLGGEDSAVTLDHYYDAAGALRFVFARAGAVNGTKVEYRVYFDARGRRIWDNRRQPAGPGYSFPAVLPEDWLVYRPDSLYVSGD